ALSADADPAATPRVEQWQARSRPRVVMLVASSVAYDSRVRRSARALTEAGLEVIVLGSVSAESAASRFSLGFEVRLVPRRREPRSLTDPLRLGMFEEIWWPLVRSLEPDVVHVHDSQGIP